MSAPTDLTGTDGSILRRDVHTPDGRLAESFVANGDGTWEHLTYNADGTMASTDDVAVLPAPLVPLYELLMTTDPTRADAVIALADGLIGQAGPLWEALVEVAESNTAKPALDIIVDQVLTAALPLTP